MMVIFTPLFIKYEQNDNLYIDFQRRCSSYTELFLNFCCPVSNQNLNRNHFLIIFLVNLISYYNIYNLDICYFEFICFVHE
ncbi:unnamed protein product [Paramecium sonneborni]|uniref:Uncharacterized protein n=1 Tax=Paramecium sonneborni TaxID=65129 RepID=A0A8S1N3C7_9CILI|nr:unnamed protein product [Paramecium sonneborni]